MKNTKHIYKKENIRRDTARPLRIGLVLITYAALFIILAVSFARTQIVRGAELRGKALDQQLLKKSISAKRGNILDRNGEVLAQSIDVDTVTVNPKLLKSKKGKEIDKNDFAKFLATNFGIDEEKTLKDLSSDEKVVTIAKQVEKEKIEALKKYQKEKGINSGVNIDKDVKRYYPYDTVASNLIGFVGRDNNGLEGLEKQLDSILRGKEGVLVSHSDVYRNPTKEEPEKLIKAENGKNVYLTIDIKLQSTVEKYLRDAVENTKSRDGLAIVMNPKTAEVLAMANIPTYNLNRPFDPIGMTKEEWEKLDLKTRSNILSIAWKNKTISDTYEPGSTFKIITSAIGLEEGKVTTDKARDFICTGFMRVFDRDIKCWRSYNPHGLQTLRQALMNSCNPAFIQLGQRIGKEIFYKYLEGFGLTTRTGIDEFHGNDTIMEARPILHDIKDVRPTELATLSFGQRFNITPIQLINAISGAVNGGDLLKPTYVLKSEDPDTKTQEYFEKKIVRQIISKETSDKIRNMLRSVVKDGTGKNAEVPGFNVGGKSGTSEPVEGDKKGEYVASFVGVAPAEDPEYVVLVILRGPKGKNRQGGQIAGPVVGHILKEIYSNTHFVSTETQQRKSPEATKAVRNVVGKSLKEARMLLKEQGFNLINTDAEDAVVQKQAPRGGSLLYSGANVYVDTGAQKQIEEVNVPRLKGLTYERAKAELKKIGLNIVGDGDKGMVMIQDPLPDAKMEKGNIVRVTIREELAEGH